MSPVDTHPLAGPDRARLVRLCASLSGDPDAAEDLAQETLLEAWRAAHRLVDPEGLDRWLAAIARNVCRRWARRRGRDAGLESLEPDAPIADGSDIELELERAELATLLDRALSLLPAATRDVLVQRFVEGSPHAEIAARLGVSEDAVSMRLARGKIVLRRVLASDLRDDALAYGLVGPEDEWRETRLWCAKCAARRMLFRRDERRVSFRCPGCSPDPSAPSSEFALANPSFASLLADVTRASAILARAEGWVARYYRPGAGAAAACTRCGREVELRRYDRGRSAGVYAACAACGETVSSSASGIAIAQPEVREFRRVHRRTATRPVRELDGSAGPALLVRTEDVNGTAAMDVLLARDTLRVIEVRGPDGRTRKTL